MSELFTALVQDLSTHVARLKVCSVHPDSGPPKPVATFALMLLYDPIIKSQFINFNKYDHLEKSPLAQEMDKASYLDPDWLIDNARAFVSKVTIQGDILEIQPTDPAWIEHLRKGMSWSTAAYVGGPGKAAKARHPSPRVTTHEEDATAGFRVGAPKEEGCPIEKAFIPLYGANRYLADPVITDPAAMKEAIQNMMGQPLLLIQKKGPPQVGAYIDTREDGLYLYYETAMGGWGGSAYYFHELTSLGRAWLKQSAPKTAKAKGTPKDEAPQAAAKKPAAAKKTAPKKA